MQLRCYRCGWSFAVKRDEITFALEALEESGGSHHDVRCPRCRHMNRISIEQLRRASPRREGGETAEAEAPSPEEASAESNAEAEGKGDHKS